MHKILFLTFILFFLGCSQVKQPCYVDVRQKMYDVIAQEEQFAKHDNVKIVSLEHIGDIHIKGKVYHVGRLLYAITDFTWPRAYDELVFFDQQFNHNTNYDIFEAGLALWCEKSKIYLDGTTNLQGFMFGNIIEFKEGFYHDYGMMIECPDGRIIPGENDPDAK